MIDFRKLDEHDRRLLAASRFGDLPASQIPADWKKRIEWRRIEQELMARGAIQNAEGADSEPVPPGETNNNESE
jgi:hypothetical protein